MLLIYPFLLVCRVILNLSLYIWWVCVSNISVSTLPDWRRKRKFSIKRRSVSTVKAGQVWWLYNGHQYCTNIAPILQQGHCCFFFLWKLINMLPSKSLPSYWSRRSQLFPLLQFTMCSISSLIKYFEVWTWCLRQWRFHTMLCRISKSCIENSVALHRIRRF